MAAQGGSEQGSGAVSGLVVGIFRAPAGWLGGGVVWWVVGGGCHVLTLLFRGGGVTLLTLSTVAVLILVYVPYARCTLIINRTPPLTWGFTLVVVSSTKKP